MYQPQLVSRISEPSTVSLSVWLFRITTIRRPNRLKTCPRTVEPLEGYRGPSPVDGSEIRRSPVEVGSLSKCFMRGFFHIPGGVFAGFRGPINQ